MTELIPAPCEKCGHTEYGMHYYVIQALIRKIARDDGAPLPKAGTGYYGNRAEAIMFDAIVEMIASNSGVGIHNCDQGHPTYRLGTKGIGHGDGPDQSRLFQTLKRFDRKHHRTIHDLSSWDKFCELVVNGVQR